MLEREVFDAPDQPLMLGLAMLVADGLVFVGVYAVALRLAAPESFRPVQDLVASVVIVRAHEDRLELALVSSPSSERVLPWHPDSRSPA